MFCNVVEELIWSNFIESTLLIRKKKSAVQPESINVPTLLKKTTQACSIQNIWWKKRNRPKIIRSLLCLTNSLVRGQGMGTANTVAKMHCSAQMSFKIWLTCLQNITPAMEPSRCVRCSAFFCSFSTLIHYRRIQEGSLSLEFWGEEAAKMQFCVYSQPGGSNGRPNGNKESCGDERGLFGDRMQGRERGR